jgi:hypothetical protein
MIGRYGYKPLEYGNTIEVLQLTANNGNDAYLVLDGNHRISALIALGYRDMNILCRVTNWVHEKDADGWPLVRSGVYTREDALKIFYAYFNGNENYRTTDVPAKIIL